MKRPLADGGCSPANQPMTVASSRLLSHSADFAAPAQEVHARPARIGGDERAVALGGGAVAVAAQDHPLGELLRDRIGNRLLHLRRVGGLARCARARSRARARRGLRPRSWSTMWSRPGRRCAVRARADAAAAAAPPSASAAPMAARTAGGAAAASRRDRLRRPGAGDDRRRRRQASTPDAASAAEPWPDFAAACLTGFGAGFARDLRSALRQASSPRPVCARLGRHGFAAACFAAAVCLQSARRRLLRAQALRDGVLRRCRLGRRLLGGFRLAPTARPRAGRSAARPAAARPRSTWTDSAGEGGDARVGYR